MNKKFVHNNREYVTRRKVLRNNLTSQEVKMWNHLRSKKLGFKFQRQHSIGPYIVDFYCPLKKLVIEIDGSQHLENKAHDDQRTLYLWAHGYRVLRFWNNEVDGNILSVLERIQEHLASF